MRSKGGSYGGGKSSIGYLFGSDDQQPTSKSTASPPAVKAPWDDDNSTAKPPNNNSSKKLNVSNNYHRAQGQNSGNFLTVSDQKPSSFLQFNCQKFIGERSKLEVLNYIF